MKLFVKPLDQWPRKWAFPLLGLGLALGAPVGLTLLRSVLTDHAPWTSWVLSEWAGDISTYMYVTLTTGIAFAVLGFHVGDSADKLRDSALTDSLTRLANRRHFYARLRDEMNRAERYSVPLSLLFIDLDGLKATNDRYGHEGGDLAIKAVAEALRLSCRETDLVARYGGDEFALIAPETLASEAMALADRVRQMLTKVRERTTLAQLSVSVGVAQYDSTLETAAAFCEAADSALYRAKRAGRDRASLYMQIEAANEYPAESAAI